jgi:type IV pilus assembly protein PilQ
MKTNSFTHMVGAASLVLFLSSCAGNQERPAFPEPEGFIEEQIPRIQRNVDLGPKVSLEKSGELANRERIQIAQEEAKSYISLDQNQDNVFPISMHFEGASMQAVAQMLSDVTGVNILVGDEVDGTVTAKLVQVPWDKALDAILKSKGLAKHVDRDANIIRIHKQDVLVSIEDFDRKRAEDLKKTIEVERAVEPLYTEIFRLYYTKPDVIKPEIESVFGMAGSGDTGSSGASSSAGPQITVDKRINSLIVKATREELDLIAKLIEQVDVRTKQILIEAFVIEATDDFDKALGARLGVDLTNAYKNTTIAGENVDSVRIAGVAGSMPDTAGSLTLGDATGAISNLAVSSPFGGIGALLSVTDSASLKFELTAMEKEGLTKIVSNPRIFTLDNEEAIVFQGEQVPYESSSGDGGGTDVEFKDAGIKLTVTPSIVGDGNVVMDVEITKDSANYANAIGNNPPIDKRQITTKLLVKDNTVAVIGGVFKQEKSDTQEKVPFFGDIPILGHLFKRDTKADQRTELLVFLAPRII